MMIKDFYIDVETTGLSKNKHAIIQLGGILEIDGEEVERVNLKMRPFEGDLYHPKALEINGTTKEEILKYPDPKEVMSQLIGLMGRYVDRFNKNDKFYFIGYNSGFDKGFVRRFFEKLDDPYYGAWFHEPDIDVMGLASNKLKKERHKMKNFKLMTVAEHLGIKTDEELAHDAMYDIIITREVYKLLNRRNENH